VRALSGHGQKHVEAKTGPRAAPGAAVLARPGFRAQGDARLSRDLPGGEVPMRCPRSRRVHSTTHRHFKDAPEASYGHRAAPILRWFGGVSHQHENEGRRATQVEADASVVCSADTGCAGLKSGVVPHAHPNPHYHRAHACWQRGGRLRGRMGAGSSVEQCSSRRRVAQAAAQCRWPRPDGAQPPPLST
jgi:hypothetical protein